MVRTFKLIIAYDGTDYCGWQKQMDQVTVEGELIKACAKVFQKEAHIMGSSRTDSGVHALGQVVAVSVETSIEEKKVAKAINAYLPLDIVVQSAVEIEPGFHPRYHAIEKTYVYKIYNAFMPLPQHNRFAAYYPNPLDIERMRKACPYFLGEHDFFAFSAAGGSVKTSVRTLKKFEIVENNGLIEITVTGNAFLYNMVRIIVGTLTDIGVGKKEPEEIPEIIASMDRLRPGKKAPAKGLTLIEIKY